MTKTEVRARCNHSRGGRNKDVSLVFDRPRGITGYRLQVTGEPTARNTRRTKNERERERKKERGGGERGNILLRRPLDYESNRVLEMKEGDGDEIVK